MKVTKLEYLAKGGVKFPRDPVDLEVIFREKIILFKNRFIAFIVLFSNSSGIIFISI